MLLQPLILSGLAETPGFVFCSHIWPARNPKKKMRQLGCRTAALAVGRSTADYNRKPATIQLKTHGH
jgi:hypothetical protein